MGKTGSSDAHRKKRGEERRGREKERRREREREKELANVILTMMPCNNAFRFE